MLIIQHFLKVETIGGLTSTSYVYDAHRRLAAHTERRHKLTRAETVAHLHANLCMVPVQVFRYKDRNCFSRIRCECL